MLVTTRISGGRDGIPTPSLAREELYKIFDRHGADVSQPERDALIDTVAGHTMTVDMIARTLADEWCNASAEDICDAMKGSAMEEDDYPDIDTDHDGDPEQRKIYGHLCALFRLQGMSEEERQTLRCAALLPPEGMHNQLFRKALPESCRKSIENLHKRGWVQSENKLLTIHPVVRFVCCRKFSPTTENCDDFLRWFEGQYDEKTYDRVKYAQIAALYETASEVLRETDGLWAHEAGYLWDVLGELQRALKCSKRAVELLEQNASNSPALATAYNNLSSAYGALGNLEKELEYQLKALEIKKQTLEFTHPSLANSYDNIGMTYGAQGDHEKALKYLLIALAIREEVLPSPHLDLALSYNNVGSIYGALGDHKKALEYKLKALEIREQVLPLTHPDVAASYNNVGHTYGNLGNHEKALEYQLKALEIREQVLPSTHPHLALSYNNVGSAYCFLGNNERALEYQQKALVIWEQVLPSDHPNNVMCRSNIAYTYVQMEDFVRAADYMRRALDSAERSLRNHPDLEMYRQLAQDIERCAKAQKEGLPFDNPFR